MDEPNGELKAKVDALTEAVYGLKTQAALTEQRVINHERTVREALADQRTRTDAVERKIEIGFLDLHADNAKQTELLAGQSAELAKWGTVRDTLFWAGIIISGAVGAVWALFVWATNQFWHK